MPFVCIAKKASVTAEQPVIKKELQPTELVEGEPGELKVQVDGTPQPDIQWFDPSCLLPIYIPFLLPPMSVFKL